MAYGKAAPKLPGWKLDNRFDISTYYPGVPGNSQVLARYVAVRRVRIPANFFESKLSALAAATGSVTITVAQNGTTVGTIVVSASGTTGTFSTSSPWDIWLVAGDVLTITGPVTADATLSDIAITIAASA